MVSIIIVTYNNEGDIIRCLTSLQKQAYQDIEIILIDNASHDQTVNIVHKHFPNVKVVQNANYGYSYGNNIGARMARGEYLAFLNPDTIVDVDWLKPLVDVLDNNTSIGAIQPLILLASPEGSVNNSGLLVNFLGFSWCREYKKRYEQVRRILEVDAISGAAMVVRKAIFNEVGGFDNTYFLFHEDVDLSWRIRLKGYTLYTHYQSHIIHDYAFRDSSWQYFYLERNRLITILKNYSLRTLVVILPALVVMEVGMMMYSMYKGWFFEKMRSYISLISTFRHIYTERLRIQRTRKVTDRKLTNNYRGIILFENINNAVLRYVANPILGQYWRLMRHLLSSE